jgi:hypothetical protein
MKAYHLILSGVCLVALSGCISTVTSPVALQSPADQARACVESKEHNGVPEIMTYNNGVETHYSGDGSKQTFSAQDKKESTAYAISGSTKKRGATPAVCHEDGVDQGKGLVAAGVVAAAVAATVK